MNKTQVRANLEAEVSRYTLPEGVEKIFGVEMKIEGVFCHLQFVGISVLDSMGDDFHGYALDGATMYVRPIPRAHVELGLSMWIEVKDA